jgi:hypothetical protein
MVASPIRRLFAAVALGAALLALQAPAASAYEVTCKSRGHATQLKSTGATCTVARRVVARFYGGTCFRNSGCVLKVARRSWTCTVYPSFWRCTAGGPDAFAKLKWRDDRSAR